VFFPAPTLAVCDGFKRIDVPSRWGVAKRLRLCYRCLRRDHKGDRCTRSRECGIDGCQDTHNRLLHGQPLERDEATFHRPHQEPERGPVKDISQKGDNVACPSTIGKQRSLAEQSLTTTMGAPNAPERAHFVALRTVPVVLKNGSRKLVVNALLEDASPKTYINGDVAAE